MYSNEAERADYEIHGDFKLKKKPYSPIGLY